VTIILLIGNLSRIIYIDSRNKQNIIYNPLAKSQSSISMVRITRATESSNLEYL